MVMVVNRNAFKGRFCQFFIGSVESRKVFLFLENNRVSKGGVIHLWQVME